MLGFVKRWLFLREVRRTLEQLDKGGQMNFLKAFFGGSKKATALLVGVTVLVARNYFGIDDATAAKISQVLMAYLGGQGLADLGLALAGSKEK
jgi:hypothetical protein